MVNSLRNLWPVIRTQIADVTRENSSLTTTTRPLTLANNNTLQGHRGLPLSLLARGPNLHDTPIMQMNAFAARDGISRRVTWGYVIALFTYGTGISVMGLGAVIGGGWGWLLGLEGLNAE